MAAMIGTLALLAVVCSVSVALSPAHLFFAARVREYSIVDGGDRYINITIVANNTSKHARVKYRSMKTEVWLTDAQWVPVDFDNYTTSVGFADLGWQPPANSTRLSAKKMIPPEGTYELPRDNCKDSGGNDQCTKNNSSSKEHTVVIKTQVQFRYGPVPTRLYSILVTCPSVAISESDYDDSIYSINDFCSW
uniref:Late embryogenesis abundant protein LEA-2 subgroup domain-containing protein n=1 Tax=Oryza punctata TaxID=4537 RepID=A0A0E0L758_ORYPU